MRRGISYREAINVLGVDPSSIAALDRALGGALSIASGGMSNAVFDIFGAQPRFVGIGRQLILGVREGLRGTARVERTRRLEAAVSVVVVTAYFEALGDLQLPFEVKRLNLTRADQLRLTTGSSASNVVEAVLSAPPPVPAPDRPYERLLEELHEWYGEASIRLSRFLEGLSVWDEITLAQRGLSLELIGEELPRLAVVRFEELYSQLVLDVPDFRYWTYQVEQQATRSEIRWALSALAPILSELSSTGTQFGPIHSLARAYQAELDRPILSDADTGIPMPLLRDAYIDPDFKVRALATGENPADEDAWLRAPLRSDLSEYLAGRLTSQSAISAPTIVLGQPGAGKSVLTKVLAARLPASDFMPVRVVLREIPAEFDIQDQLEYAIRRTTGDRADWPTVARSANGALPVLLFDGFDELLQATGVSQTDYLLRIARFQERELQQGRPVAALVTSRVAVADRARYPSGTITLRLEPFSEAQTSAWIGRWNRHNSSYFRRASLAPFTHEVARRHSNLATQPLLLLMLALYDAENNALQRRSTDSEDGVTDESTLYESLLVAFARREVGKIDSLRSGEDVQVEAELQRLSLVALGMMNRRRQWITERELESDLIAILGRQASRGQEFRAPLSQAELSLGSFFFIQRAQAIQGDSQLQTYEFLHATFGEYLAARLAVQLTASLLKQQPVLAVGSERLDDELLYTLYSFAPLSSRQQLRFVRGCVKRIIPLEENLRLTQVLVKALKEGDSRLEHRHSSYDPVALPTAWRHGLYSVNLVILVLTIAESMTAAQLFPGQQDPAGFWRRRTNLWRSAMSEPEWTDVALALSVRQIWVGSEREMEVSLATEDAVATKPVNVYWHYRYHPEHDQRGNVIWRRSYVNEVLHKMEISGGTNESAIRHALEPLTSRIGATVMTFSGLGDAPATSFAYDLMDLWLTSTISNSPTEIEQAYRRCADLLRSLEVLGVDMRDAVVIILRQLLADVSTLPHTLIIEILITAKVYAGHLLTEDARIVRLVELCASLALSRPDLEPHAQSSLARLATATPE